MYFLSFEFAVFFSTVFLLYWKIAQKYRWIVLLCASYFFYYCCNAKHVALIFIFTCISYVAARLIEMQHNNNNKKSILVIATLLCLGLLFVFKYFNFFSESFARIFNEFSVQVDPIVLEILLPVGISFYTFQTLSYMFDVYKGEIVAEKHFGYYATFISFFPQLVAGPIERTGNLLIQIKEKREFDYEQATYGIKLMTWGIFKKIVIADTLSIYVSKVFDIPYSYSGFALVLASLFFSLQIYCDFSGYSDIAIGTAKLLGINLMTNFKSPYFSQSVKEFWSRWHISLSTWFRDYLYIPLGGSRVGKMKQFANLFITFGISGLWHGANWTYIVWGVIHGVAQAFESLVLPHKESKVGRGVWLIRVTCIFILVSVAWIFFRANSIMDALYVLTHCLVGINAPLQYIKKGFGDIGIGRSDITLLTLSVILLCSFDYFSLKCDVINLVSSKKCLLRWTIYIALIMWIIINTPVSNKAEFIYFQF